MVNVKKELSSGQMILLPVPVAEYNNEIVSVMKQVSGNVCYVTMNKTVDSLKELFKKKGVSIGKVIFIDAISKTIKKVPDQAEGVYYVSSPGALTELSLAIEKFLKHEFDYLIFDSLTNLAIYQKKNICIKFMTDLVNKVRKVKTKAIFYSIGGEGSAWVVDHVGSMVDSVVSDKASGKKEGVGKKSKKGGVK